MNSDSDGRGGPARTNVAEAAAKERLADLRLTSLFLSVFVLVGVVSLLLQNLGARFPAILWALACLAAGDMLGFLFGIPRVLQQDEAKPPASQPADAKAAASANQETSYRQQVNTNLEQISDWLTKIIVGIGLIELRRLPDAVNRLSLFVSKSLGASPEGQGLAAAIIIYFTVLGFLSGYLLTRIYLSGAFRRADTEGYYLVGGIRTTVPALFEQLYKAITDLQKPVAAEGEQGGQTASPDARVGLKASASPAPPAIQSVLWVDNHMEGNSLVVDELKKLGVEVVTRLSTDQALALIDTRKFDVVITDMSRPESPTAGLDLVRAVRESALNKGARAIIYCSKRNAAKYAAAAEEARADAITGSTTALRRLLKLDS